MTSHGGSPRLVAHTTRLDADVDLIAVAGSDGVLFEQGGAGLAGRGVAARITLPEGPGRLEAAAEPTREALAGIEAHDEVGRLGCGPIAFAALPFEEDAPAELIVPSLIVGRSDDGARWVTIIQPADAAPTDVVTTDGELVPGALGAPVAETGADPMSFTVRAAQSPDAWCDSVGEAVRVMTAGGLDKVVLAREILVEADAPLNITDILQRLRLAYPSSMVYAIGGFIGASPELLVSRNGDVIRSHPMAGTAPRRGDATVDARQAASLLASSKDRDEHQITIDMVLDAVLPFCSYVDSEPEPSIVSVANVHHLASLVEGRLSSPPASVLTLVGALHPTPAVCGRPRSDALDLIHKLEPFNRGRYAGPVGWVDAQGNGRFAVAIRCAEIAGNRARLFAGNGLVAGSDPRTELAETRAKLQAVLAAIVRP
ncbi:MAG: isochorismate synthase [Actinobacteria bacterium]|nr:isochorismate synthase [Actinomycetota bacterium]